MESSKVAEGAKRQAPVIWQGHRYTLTGYQVCYKSGEVIKSRLLLDDMRRMHTVRITDFEEAGG